MAFNLQNAGTREEGEYVCTRRRVGSRGSSSRAAHGCLCSHLWLRMTARPASGRHVVDVCVSVTSSRSILYIQTLCLSNLRRFYLSFRICVIKLIKLVTSHLGETYSEDVRGQAMLGGFFWLRICEWAVYFYIYMAYSFHKMHLNDLRLLCQF